MMTRVRTQNNELQVILDKLNQLFILDHNQVEDAKQWEARIQNIQQEITNIHAKENETVKSFSAIREEQDAVLLNLNQISNDQTTAYKTIATYPQIANDLKKTANDAMSTFNKIKATIDRLNLPGVSPDYKLAYINTKETLQKFIENMEAPRINLDESQRQAMQVTSDLDSFKTVSTSVYMYSNLAQQAIRYLVRFQGNPAIGDAYRRASIMYDNDFNYEFAAEEAGRVIEGMEPGRYQSMKRDMEERSISPF
jgi:septation ring formation regulator